MTVGLLAVADHPVDQGEDRPLIPADQLTVGRLLAVAGAQDYVLVGQLP